MDSDTLWAIPPELALAFRYRERPEDFVVEERPDSPPEGRGEHLSLRIEKLGLSTPAAEGRIASALGVRRGAVRRAGLKDAQARTIQELTVHDPTGALRPEAVGELELGPGLRVLEATRRERGLRPGRHAGNRFELTLRACDPSEDAFERLEQGLALLAARGVPARFGLQRFGRRGDGAAIGLALLRGDADEAVARICGRPHPNDTDRVREARERFDAGDLAAAAEAFPPEYGSSRRLARALISNRGRAANALRALRLDELQLWIDAAQSAVFNAVCDLRRPHLERLLRGDLVRPTDGDRDSAIEDPDPWQPRADAFELSATGPLPGPRVPLASGPAGELERAALAELGAGPELFDAARKYRVHGARRPLRFRLEDPIVERLGGAAGDPLRVRFGLPPGGYATVVLEELARGAAVAGN